VKPGRVVLERVSLERARWFIVHRGTREYQEFGFPTKDTALAEVNHLNESETAAGREALYAVSPLYRPPTL